MMHMREHNFHDHEPYVKPYPGWVCVLFWGIASIGGWPLLIFVGRSMAALLS